MKKTVASMGMILLLVQVGWAEIGVQDVTNALVRMEARKPSEWAYTQALSSSDEESIARHDPRLPDAFLGWTLLSMNGREPSKKEVKKFCRKIEAEAKTAETKKAERADEAAPVLSDLIRLETLKPSGREKAGRVPFSFVPKIKDLEDHLLGALVYNVPEQRIDAIKVWNSKDYSPAFSVTVSTFSLDMTFGPQGSDNVLTQMVTVVKGTIGFLKKVDETVVVKLSDYELLDK